MHSCVVRCLVLWPPSSLTIPSHVFVRRRRSPASGNGAMRGWWPRDPDRACRTRRGESAGGADQRDPLLELREARLWQRSTGNTSSENQTYALNLSRGNGRLEHQSGRPAANSWPRASQIPGNGGRVKIIFSFKRAGCLLEWQQQHD